MVNIDEMNKNIENLGKVIEGLSKLNDIYDKMQENAEKQEKTAEEIKVIYNLQEKLEQEIKTTLNNLQIDMLRKLDDTQTNIKDRVVLAEKMIGSQVSESTSELKKMTEEQSSQVKKLIVETKDLITQELQSMRINQDLKFKRLMMLAIGGMIWFSVLSFVVIYFVK